jgi:hypothetical protein
VFEAFDDLEGSMEFIKKNRLGLKLGLELELELGLNIGLRSLLTPTLTLTLSLTLTLTLNSGSKSPPLPTEPWFHSADLMVENYQNIPKNGMSGLGLGLGVKVRVRVHVAIGVSF